MVTSFACVTGIMPSISVLLWVFGWLMVHLCWNNKNTFTHPILGWWPKSTVLRMGWHQPVEMVKKTMQENMFLHWTSLNQFCASPPLHLQITFPKIVSLKFAIETPARSGKKGNTRFPCPKYMPYQSDILSHHHFIVSFGHPKSNLPLWSPLFNGHFWAHMPDSSHDHSSFKPF